MGGARLNVKFELSREAHGTQHAQRIFGETLLRFVANGAQELRFQILLASKRIDNLICQRLAGHSIDSKFAAVPGFYQILSRKTPPLSRYPPVYPPFKPPGFQHISSHMQ